MTSYGTHLLFADPLLSLLAGFASLIICLILLRIKIHNEERHFQECRDYSEHQEENEFTKGCYIDHNQQEIFATYYRILPSDVLLDNPKETDNKKRKMRDIYKMLGKEVSNSYSRIKQFTTHLSPLRRRVIAWFPPRW